MRRMSVILASGLVFLLALLAGGCLDETSSLPSAPGAGGMITGRVYGVGDPTRVKITVQSAEADPHVAPGTSVLLHGTVDTGGDFVVGAPPGSYLVMVTAAHRDYYYSLTGLHRLERQADTIGVAQGEVAGPLQIWFGSLVVRLRVDPVLEGRSLGLDLEEWSRRGTLQCWLSAAARGEVHQGEVVFTFPEVPVGTYAAALNPGFRYCFIISDSWPALAERSGPVPEDEDRIWLGDGAGHSAGKADSMTVSGAQTRTWESVLSAAPSVLRGQIRGSWQLAGLSPPYVVMYNADSVEVASQRTDGQGRFAFELLYPEPMKLLVSIASEGYRWIGGTSFRDAALFSLMPGQDIDGIGFEESAIAIDLDAPRFDDDIDVVAEAFDAEGRNVAHSYAGYKTWRILLGCLDPGSYRIRLRNTSFLHEDWLDQWYDSADSLGATPVTVAGPGQIVHVRAHLVEGGRISGTVAGASVSGWKTVALTTAASPAILGELQVFSGDAFGFRGLADGLYKIGASPVGEDGHLDPDSTIWYPHAAAWESAQAIAITGHARVDSLVLTLP